jgi:hypothetical protein
LSILCRGAHIPIPIPALSLPIRRTPASRLLRSQLRLMRRNRRLPLLLRPEHLRILDRTILQPSTQSTT